MMTQEQEQEPQTTTSRSRPTSPPLTGIGRRRSNRRLRDVHKLMKGLKIDIPPVPPPLQQRNQQIMDDHRDDLDDQQQQQKHKQQQQQHHHQEQELDDLVRGLAQLQQDREEEEEGRREGRHLQEEEEEEPQHRRRIQQQQEEDDDQLNHPRRNNENPKLQQQKSLNKVQIPQLPLPPQHQYGQLQEEENLKEEEDHPQNEHEHEQQHRQQHQHQHHLRHYQYRHEKQRKEEEEDPHPINIQQRQHQHPQDEQKKFVAKEEGHNHRHHHHPQQLYENHRRRSQYLEGKKTFQKSSSPPTKKTINKKIKKKQKNASSSPMSSSNATTVGTTTIAETAATMTSSTTAAIQTKTQVATSVGGSSSSSNVDNNPPYASAPFPPQASSPPYGGEMIGHEVVQYQYQFQYDESEEEEEEEGGGNDFVVADGHSVVMLNDDDVENEEEVGAEAEAETEAAVENEYHHHNNNNNNNTSVASSKVVVVDGDEYTVDYRFIDDDDDDSDDDDHDDNESSAEDDVGEVLHDEQIYDLQHDHQQQQNSPLVIHHQEPQRYPAEAGAIGSSPPMIGHHHRHRHHHPRHYHFPPLIHDSTAINNGDGGNGFSFDDAGGGVGIEVVDYGDASTIRTTISMENEMMVRHQRTTTPQHHQQQQKQLVSDARIGVDVMAEEDNSMISLASPPCNGGSLLDLIAKRKFKLALDRVQKFPQEASITWYDAANRHHSVALLPTSPSKASRNNLQQQHDREMNLPLHEACRYQAPPALISALIQSYEGACSHIGQWGYMPLHFACSARGTDPAVVCLLIAHYPSATRHRTFTTQQLPLHLAAEWGVSDPTTLLALLTVHPKGYLVKDSFGKTPLDYAIETSTAATSCMSDGRNDNNNSSNKMTVDVLTHCAPMLLQVSKAAMSKLNWDSENKIRDMKSKMDEDFVHEKQTWEQEKVRMESRECDLKQDLRRAKQSNTELQREVDELRSSRSMMMTKLQESRSQNTHLTQQLSETQQKCDIKVEKQTQKINELQISLQSKDVEIEETKRVVNNLQTLQQQQQPKPQYSMPMSKNPNSGDEYQPSQGDFVGLSQRSPHHTNEIRTRPRSKSPQRQRDSQKSPSRKIREDPIFRKSAYDSRGVGVDHQSIISQSHASSMKNNNTVYSDGLFQRQQQLRQHNGKNHEESGKSLPSPSNKRRMGYNGNSPRRNQQSTTDDDLLNSLLGSDEICDDTVGRLDGRKNDDWDRRGAFMDGRDERNGNDRFDHHLTELSSSRVPSVVDTAAEHKWSNLSLPRSKSTPRQGRQILRNIVGVEFTRQQKYRRSKSAERTERFGRHKQTQEYGATSRNVLNRTHSQSLSSLSNSISVKPKIVSSTPSLVAEQDFHGHHHHHGRDMIVGMKGSKSVYEHRPSPTKFGTHTYMAQRNDPNISTSQKQKSPRSYFTEMMMSDDEPSYDDNDFDHNLHYSQVQQSRSMITSPYHQGNTSPHNRRYHRNIGMHGFNGYEAEEDMDMMSQDYRQDRYQYRNRSRIDYD